MVSTNKTLKGVIHGKTIELEREVGLPDGQEVTVTVQAPPRAIQQLAPGEGTRRSAGAWSDDAAGLDKYLQWNRKQRKADRRGA